MNRLFSKFALLGKTGNFCADLPTNLEGISEDMTEKLDDKDAKNCRFNEQMQFQKRSNKKRTRGASLIEFALILPVLLLIIEGIMEYSIIYYDKAIITNASREAARYGVVLRSSPTYATSASIITFAKNYCDDKLITFGADVDPTVTVVNSPTTPAFGGTLKVTVNYQYTGLILYQVMSTAKVITLTASTTMTYE
ncbi:MAG: TadE/TadG family type IV pilus assembly protein [Chlamydiales bacterium]|nr:TadE/TadG family type IV pilus assembly protein [Chlamydiales bacterium]